MGTPWQTARRLATVAALGLVVGWGATMGCAGGTVSATAPGGYPGEDAVAEADPCVQDCREIRQICLNRITVPSSVPRGAQATTPPPGEADPGDLAAEARCNRAYRDCADRCEEKRAATEEVAPLP